MNSNKRQQLPIPRRQEDLGDDAVPGGAGAWEIWHRASHTIVCKRRKHHTKHLQSLLFISPILSRLDPLLLSNFALYFFRNIIIFPCSREYLNSRSGTQAQGEVHHRTAYRPT